jgi:hypothetical protein
LAFVPGKPFSLQSFGVKYYHPITIKAASCMSKKTTDNDDYNEIYNETSNTDAGINTPKEREDSSPLDMVSGAVKEIVDNVQRAFGGDPEPDHKETGFDKGK